MNGIKKTKVLVELSPASLKKAKDDSKKLFNGVENLSSYIEYLILMKKPTK